MHCHWNWVNSISGGMILVGLCHVVHHRQTQTSYGRHLLRCTSARTVPAKLAWFLQEMPALLFPLLLMLSPHKDASMGKNLLLGTFCIHYFQRTLVYSLLTRGKPVPLRVMVTAALFCSINGFLQGHYLLHCAHFDHQWSGCLLFFVGMAINVHSDCILRRLRLPGDVIYKIPTGGLFNYVSAANYLGEIVEWFGFAIVTWSVPGLSFAVFTLSFLGPRAYYHHRFYQEKFKDYPKSRKALLPFLF